MHGKMTKLNKYARQTRLLVAVDCIIFGFDGTQLKILLIKRVLQPLKGNWSLMGGFIGSAESADEAAERILKKLTGLSGVYLEQMHCFGDPKRDTIERTISVAYFALIDIHKYKEQISHEYHAEWFALNEIPKLLFDHASMIEMGRKKLQYKAALHPILFELLPAKFTLPQLLILYEAFYDASIDKRNFTRKVQTTGLLVKLNEKDKDGSKKGAFYYKLNRVNYRSNLQAFLYIVPNAHKLF